MAPDTMPTMAKAGANYMNGQLIKLEAIANGYVEGIALDTFGYVSEGSGENIFIIRDGVLYTPPISAAILPGITRDSLLTLAHDLGIKVAEQNILREALYIADEVFMCGSASEVTPVTRIDKQVIGSGVAGVITKKLQKAFFDIVECKVPDRHNWLTFVRSGKRVSVPK
jgi:branched-chain amino acid aminotransferase